MEWYIILIRIILAAIIGMVIGLEREFHGHPAGIKTHAMVAVGAAIAAIIQILLAQDYPGQDVTRIISQVISGVGFIGAGCILHNKENIVKGLTTASTLWVVACLGISAGLGYYILTVSASALILLILIIMGTIRSWRNHQTEADD